jgi:hypothetical protein
MDNLQEYLRIKEAAEFIGVSESTLRNWAVKARSQPTVIRSIDTGFSRNTIWKHCLWKLSGLSEGGSPEKPTDRILHDHGWTADGVHCQGTGEMSASGFHRPIPRSISLQ